MYFQLTFNTIYWIQTPFQHLPQQCFPKSLSKFRFLPIMVFSLATFALWPLTFTCIIQLPGTNSNSSSVNKYYKITTIQMFPWATKLRPATIVPEIWWIRKDLNIKSIKNLNITKKVVYPQLLCYILINASHTQHILVNILSVKATLELFQVF